MYSTVHYEAEKSKWEYRAEDPFNVVQVTNFLLRGPACLRHTQKCVSKSEIEATK